MEGTVGPGLRALPPSSVKRVAMDASRLDATIQWYDTVYNGFPLITVLRVDARAASPTRCVREGGTLA